MNKLLACLVMLLPMLCQATTWDEPWMQQVIAAADSFVKVDVLSSDQKGFRARVIKHLAGQPTPQSIEVVGFSMLRFGSYSGHHDEVSLRFNPARDYYLFLMPGSEPGQYLIATPSTGWAQIIDAEVAATYRHSKHKAEVPGPVYEMSMTAIFKRLHGDLGGNEELTAFIRKQLSDKPADTQRSGAPDPEGNRKFSLQHVALESFRLFGKESELALIDPFLAADSAHVQISAVRAISNIKSREVTARLIQFIESDRNGFAKVMAVWGLDALNARETRSRLEAFVARGKDERTGFGGNIMDPVKSRFPDSVKTAVSELLAKWK